MNPLDHLALPEKFAVGVTAPIAGILTAIPTEINPLLQTVALLAGILVSILSALSIIRKNIRNPKK